LNMADDRQSAAYWMTPITKLLQDLESSEQGLSQAVAQRRITSVQPLRARKRPAWKLLLDQFKNPIILLLACSAVLSFTLPGEQTNGWIIVSILLASGLLGFWQELTAADAVAKLMRMIETKATVIRDGQDRDVPLDEIVPGDVVHLRAGDLIPGDCRLITARDLYVNEATLTGESFPAEKSTDVVSENATLRERSNVLFLGTHVVSGIGTAVVVGTGLDTEFGRISARLQRKAPETGFERGLRHFGQLLVKVVLVITAVVFAIKVGLQGKPIAESLLVGLALAVGMTPQLLPAVTSVVLSAGAKAMARQKVIVKQLLSIENLGSMTVLCSDKTGTLTEGVIHLREACNADGDLSERVGRFAFLNAFFQTGFTNPIDNAIVAAGHFETAQVQKVDEIPYDFVRKRLSVLIESDGQTFIVTKGALANVLDVCAFVETSAGQRVNLWEHRASIDKRFAAWSDEGLRVLGLAIRRVDAARISKTDELDMTFLGFLVFTDPPKPGVQKTLEQLKNLGVGLKIITGDNRAVAKSLSNQFGIDSSIIVTGADLLKLSDEALHQRARDTNVFAEVEPNQKERIIRALQHSGATVGYIGDGINDVSALHAADVGISVASAVDVAKEAAQVVMLEHDLGVLVQGVRQGRQTFSNTLKYVFFAIAANFGYMFSLAIASLLLPFEPLLASQILLVNLLADFPAMALASDRVDPEQIERPRRWDVRFILRFMMSFGFASSCFDFLTFGAILYFFGGQNHDLFRTGWFVESTLTGLMILLVIRTQRTFFESRPGTLFLVAEISVATVVLLLPFSPLASTLGFVAPPLGLLVIVLVITALYGIGMETVKRLFYRYLAD
jgi:P-type Mg2+ transporter